VVLCFVIQTWAKEFVMVLSVLLLGWSSLGGQFVHSFMDCLFI